MNTNRLDKPLTCLLLLILAALLYAPHALSQGAGAVPQGPGADRAPTATPTPAPRKERVKSRARAKLNRTATPVRVARRLQTVNLLIKTTPPNCFVFIDDERVGKTNAAGEFYIDLLPGVYDLRLVLDGYDTILDEFEVLRGDEEQQLDPYTLLPELKTFKVTTEPTEVEVYFDDAYKGTSNAQGVLLIEGVNPLQPHTLRGTKRGHEVKEPYKIDPGVLEKQIKLNPKLTTLRVVTVPPEAEVYLDGVYKGVSDKEGVLLIETNLQQEHTLRVRARTEGFAEQIITVPPDSTPKPVELPRALDVLKLNEVKQSLTADKLANAVRAYGQLAALKPDHPELPRLLEIIMQRLQARNSELLASVAPYGLATSAQQAGEMYDLFEQAKMWQRDNPALEGFAAYWDVKRWWTRSRAAGGREGASLLLNARGAANRLATFNPRDQHLSYDMGWIQREFGDIPAAVKFYVEAQSLNPKWAYPHFALATIDMATAEKEVTKVAKTTSYLHAIEGLTRAITLKPDFSAAYQIRCIAYAVLNRHVESIASGLEAVRLKPESAYAHYALGFAYYQKGYDKDKKEYRNALKEFDQALILKDEELDDGIKESVRQKLYFMRRALGIKPSGS